MNVKVITTALQHLVGGAALNVALGARLELATQEAIAARGREAIIVYQWYSRCVKDPSLEDFELWLSKKISKTKEFSQLVQDWHNFYKSRGA
jgi:hypothetical protein